MFCIIKHSIWCAIEHLVNPNHNVYAIFCLIWEFLKQIADIACKHIHVSNVHVQDKQNNNGL